MSSWADYRERLPEPMRRRAVQWDGAAATMDAVKREFPHAAVSLDGDALVVQWKVRQQRVEPGQWLAYDQIGALALVLSDECFRQNFR